ncbi:MAG: hypothetical protein CMB57_01515 [Euryarchaeota archaeon]|nr:hypothetical protein [Euryarchaeota archaeon]
MAGAVGIATTKEVQKTVEQKLTKNELINALRSSNQMSSNVWTKKHGGGRKPMSNEERARRIAARKASRAARASWRRAQRKIETRRRRAAQIPARLKALLAHKKAVQERRNARKAETRAIKEAAAKKRAADRANAKAARAQAKALADAELAEKRAERLSKLRASMEKVLSKKRSWSNAQVANLRLKLAKAKKAANVTAVRKAANAYKKKYQRKAKEVAKGSLNQNAPKPKKAKKTNAQIAAARAARLRKRFA